jgi:hypothetical protein
MMVVRLDCPTLYSTLETTTTLGMMTKEVAGGTVRGEEAAPMGAKGAKGAEGAGEEKVAKGRWGGV